MVRALRWKSWDTEKWEGGSWASRASGRRRLQGAASAVFTATGTPNTSANVEQSESFLVAYAQAR
jgi:hypothetical protein